MLTVVNVTVTLTRWTELETVMSCLMLVKYIKFTPIAFSFAHFPLSENTPKSFNKNMAFSYFQTANKQSILFCEAAFVLGLATQWSI